MIAEKLGVLPSELADRVTVSEFAELLVWFLKIKPEHEEKAMAEAKKKAK